MIQTASPELPEKGKGEQRIPTGKEFLVKQLVILQKKIKQTETDLKSKKRGVRLAHLKGLVKSYNEALVIIFGKKDSRKVINYKVVGEKVEAYIPVPGEIELAKKEKAKRRKQKKRAKRMSSAEDLFLEDEIGYDSDEVAYRLFAEEEFLFTEPVIKINTRDDIQKGTGYAVVHDNLNGLMYPIPFTFLMDLTFINLTLNLYLNSGYPVTVVVHPDDLNSPYLPKSTTIWN